MHTSLPNATLTKRLCSCLYDILILAAISLLYIALVTLFYQVVLGSIATDYKPNAQGFPVQLGWLATLVGFYCFFWLKVGQTVAMKAWRLKVVGENSSKISLSQCLIRCIFGFLSLALCGAGYFWMLVDKDGLALHDRLSNTRVIQLPKGE